MPEFNSQISWATILAVFGWIVTGGWQTFKLGGLAASQRLDMIQMRRDLDALRASHENSLREREQFQAAVTSQQQLLRMTLVDSIQEVAKTYATKDDHRILETRMDKGMDRIADKLDQLNARIEKFGDDVVRLLSERKH